MTSDPDANMCSCHGTPNARRGRAVLHLHAGAAPAGPSEILVEGSTYARSNLKARLYDSGLKRPVCELCGQGELWRGRPMGLILAHINGVRHDNRLVISVADVASGRASVMGVDDMSSTRRTAGPQAGRGE
jgi:hypothetical protein